MIEPGVCGHGSQARPTRSWPSKWDPRLFDLISYLDQTASEDPLLRPKRRAPPLLLAYLAPDRLVKKISTTSSIRDALRKMHSVAPVACQNGHNDSRSGTGVRPGPRGVRITALGLISGASESHSKGPEARGKGGTSLPGVLILD